MQVSAVMNLVREQYPHRYYTNCKVRRQGGFFFVQVSWSGRDVDYVDHWKVWEGQIKFEGTIAR